MDRVTAVSHEEKFLEQIRAANDLARQCLEEATVVSGFQTDPATVVELLERTVTACHHWQRRYEQHASQASRDGMSRLVDRFRTIAAEERQQGWLLSHHVRHLARSATPLPPSPGTTQPLGEVSAPFVDLLEEDLVAKQVSLTTQQAVIAYLVRDTMPTRALLEDVRAMARRHVTELRSLLTELRNS